MAPTPRHIDLIINRPHRSYYHVYIIYIRKYHYVSHKCHITFISHHMSTSHTSQAYHDTSHPYNVTLFSYDSIACPHDAHITIHYTHTTSHRFHVTSHHITFSNTSYQICIMPYLIKVTSTSCHNTLYQNQCLVSPPLPPHRKIGRICNI